MSDAEALRALVFAVAIGAALFLLGRLIALRVGILALDAPDGEALGIGLSTGLFVATALVATVASTGRSAFTPIAATFVLAILLTLRRPDPDPLGSSPVQRAAARWRAPLGLPSIVGAVVFVVLLALLFSATLAPSPRAGVQPVEFMDVAFYSILGRDIVATGSEAIYSPSGFGVPAGLPVQNWYHWGELWLAGAIGSIFRIEPSFARHLVVLPLLLLGLVSLVGSIARRAAALQLPAVFVFGAAAGLLLALIPFPLANNFFSGWPSGTAFSITDNGMAAVLVPLLMLLVLRGDDITHDRATSVLFIAALAAMMLPAHIATGILAGAGALVAIGALAVQLRLETGRIPRPPRTAVRLAATILATVALTFAWGTATSHAVLGSGSSPLAPPFNRVWLVAMATALVGAAALFTIPVAWLLVRQRRHELAAMLLGVMAIVGGGALAWGAWIGEFTMFHVFYGAIAIFATPMAAASIIIVWTRLREDGHRLAALALIIGSVLQLEVGAFSSGNRLAEFSPNAYAPVPLEVMAAIRALEPGAKIGYACRQREEVAYWVPQLLTIDLHTGRRIVPLCYEVDFLAPSIGADGPADAVSPQFPTSPQFELFPTADARPTPEEIMAFMKREGIGYLFVDEVHPNTLVPDAIPITTSGHTQLLRLP